MCGERAAHASPLVQACTGRRVAVFATSPAGVARPFEFRRYVFEFRRYVFEFRRYAVSVCVPCCVHRLVRVVALNSRFNAHPGSLTPKETRKATLYLSRMRLRACAGRRIIDCCMVRFAPLCALRLRSAGSPLWLTPSPVPPPCHRGALFASAGPLITTIPSRSRYMSARAAAELSLTSLAGRGACMRARRC